MMISCSTNLWSWVPQAVAGTPKAFEGWDPGHKAWNLKMNGGDQDIAI
jgi:hypothetical protein